MQGRAGGTYENSYLFLFCRRFCDPAGPCWTGRMKASALAVMLALLTETSWAATSPVHPGFTAVLRSRSLEKFSTRVLEDGQVLHQLALPCTNRVRVCSWKKHE